MYIQVVDILFRAYSRRSRDTGCLENGLLEEVKHRRVREDGVLKMHYGRVVLSARAHSVQTVLVVFVKKPSMDNRIGWKPACITLHLLALIPTVGMICFGVERPGWCVEN